MLECQTQRSSIPLEGRKLVRLIYLDEAGNTGTNLDDLTQPIHVVCGVIIRDSEWLSIENQVNQLISYLIPRAADREDFEFHTCDIFQGHGFFKGWRWDARVDALTRLLAIIVDNNLPIIYGAVHKQDHKAKYAFPAAPHDISFLLCAERVERWFKNRASDDVGMFIADETKAKSDMKKSLKEYRKIIALGGRGDRLEHIIDTIHFADSRETYGIQLADAANYIIKRRLLENARALPFYEQISGNIYAGRLLP